jgi:broad-specificity NMP kinase
MPKKSGILVIAVTGTPAAGKSTFAKSLSKDTGLKCVEVNDVVEEKKLFSSEDENGSKIVKMQELTKALKAIIKNDSDGKGIILVGHLLADLNLDYDITAVIRSNLKEIIDRMEKRNYQREKIKENLVSESIDYCGVQIADKSKECYEIETDSQKAVLSDYIRGRVSGQAIEKPNLPEIDKLEEMLLLVYDGNEYGL